MENPHREVVAPLRAEAERSKQGRGRPRKYTDEERRLKKIESTMKHRLSHLIEYNKYHREYYHRQKTPKP